jgi:hypothetical protein
MDSQYIDPPSRHTFRPKCTFLAKLMSSGIILVKRIRDGEKSHSWLYCELNGVSSCFERFQKALR